MSRSMLMVNRGFLEAVCLKGANAMIVGMHLERNEIDNPILVLEIEGPDVPDAPRVYATVHQTVKLEPAP